MSYPLASQTQAQGQITTTLNQLQQAQQQFANPQQYTAMQLFRPSATTPIQSMQQRQQTESSRQGTLQNLNQYSNQLNSYLATPAGIQQYSTELGNNLTTTANAQKSFAYSTGGGSGVVNGKIVTTPSQTVFQPYTEQKVTTTYTSPYGTYSQVTGGNVTAQTPYAFDKNGPITNIPSAPSVPVVTQSPLVSTPNPLSSLFVTPKTPFSFINASNAQPLVNYQFPGGNVTAQTPYAFDKNGPITNIPSAPSVPVVTQSPLVSTPNPLSSLFVTPKTPFSFINASNAQPLVIPPNFLQRFEQSKQGYSTLGALTVAPFEFLGSEVARLIPTQKAGLLDVSPYRLSITAPNYVPGRPFTVEQFLSPSEIQQIEQQKTDIAKASAKATVEQSPYVIGGILSAGGVIPAVAAGGALGALSFLQGSESYSPQGLAKIQSKYQLQPGQTELTIPQQAGRVVSYLAPASQMVLGAYGVEQGFLGLQNQAIKVSKPEIAIAQPIPIKGGKTLVQQTIEQRIPYPGFRYNPFQRTRVAIDAAGFPVFAKEPTLTGFDYISPRISSRLSLTLTPTENSLYPLLVDGKVSLLPRGPGFEVSGGTQSTRSLLNPITGSSDITTTPWTKTSGWISAGDAAKLLGPEFNLKVPMGTPRVSELTPREAGMIEGVYIPEESKIYINNNLPPKIAKEVLQHEMGHSFGGYTAGLYKNEIKNWIDSLPTKEQNSLLDAATIHLNLKYNGRVPAGPMGYNTPADYLDEYFADLYTGRVPSTNFKVSLEKPVTNSFFGYSTLDTKNPLSEYYGGYITKESPSGSLETVSGPINTARYYRAQDLITGLAEPRTAGLILPEKTGTDVFTILPSPGYQTVDRDLNVFGLPEWSTKAARSPQFGSDLIPPSPEIIIKTKFDSFPLGPIGQSFGRLGASQFTISPGSYLPSLEFPSTKTKTFQDLNMNLIQNPKEVQIPKQTTGPKVIDSQAPSLVQIPSLVPSLVEIPVQVPVQVPKIIQIPIQTPVQKQIQIITPTIPPPIVNPNLYSKPPIPPIPFDNTDNNKKKKPLFPKKKTETGYEVLVRTKGKFQPISPYAYPKSEAIAIGAREVTTGRFPAQASFQIIPSTKPLKTTGIEVPSNLSATFRPPKRGPGNIFVQRREARISSPAEKTAIAGLGAATRKGTRTSPSPRLGRSIFTPRKSKPISFGRRRR